MAEERDGRTQLKRRESMLRVSVDSGSADMTILPMAMVWKVSSPSNHRPPGREFHHRSHPKAGLFSPAIDLDFKFHFQFFCNLVPDRFDQLCHLTAGCTIPDYNVVPMLFMEFGTANFLSIQTCLFNQV